MLRADDVMERFELLAELTPEEAERYRVLCADAALHVKNMLQHEAPEEADRLFCFAAAALAHTGRRWRTAAQARRPSLLGISRSPAERQSCKTPAPCGRTP